MSLGFALVTAAFLAPLLWASLYFAPAWVFCALVGVAVSTAHRLLQTLAYRDFARQSADRTYVAGPALRALPTRIAPIPILRDAASGVMAGLVDATEESVHLMVLAGAEVHFIATVECRRVLAVGDRTGKSLPAELTSGGKAMLAALPREDIDELYRDLPPDELVRLRRRLAAVRRQGYALNSGQTERGLTAIGVGIDGSRTAIRAALCISMPTARFSRDRLPALVDALRSAAEDVERRIDIHVLADNS